MQISGALCPCDPCVQIAACNGHTLALMGMRVSLPCEPGIFTEM